jgi:hypothetical protein
MTAMREFLRGQYLADLMKTFDDAALAELARESSDAAAIGQDDDAWSDLCAGVYVAARDESERRGNS